MPDILDNPLDGRSATTPSAPMHFPWKRLREMWSCDQAEHARVGLYELIAWDATNIPDRRLMPRFGWELYTGPKLFTQVAKGAADSYDAAKQAAEAAYRAATAPAEAA